VPGVGGVLTGGCGPAGWPPVARRRRGSGVVMMSEALVARWEAVYQAYGLASEMVSNSVPGDGAVARRMARASRDVAAVWREMAAEPDMPWWTVAGLSAAAQAFEYQARDWAARARYDQPMPLGQAGERQHRTFYPFGERGDVGGVVDAH
jgi:hypothetical protein